MRVPEVKGPGIGLRSPCKISLRGPVNARILQRVSMNLSMTVGQAACRLLCQYTQSTLAAFAESYRLLRVN